MKLVAIVAQSSTLLYRRLAVGVGRHFHKSESYECCTAEFNSALQRRTRSVKAALKKIGVAWVAMPLFAVMGATAQTNTNSAAVTAPASATTNDVEAAAALAKFGSRGVRVHDPSTIVKCKDEYWIFYTGRGVSSYRSKDLKEWTPGPRIFTNPPSWAAEAVPANQGTHYWAPDVIHWRGRYMVYYSISSWGKNTSAIGLVTNPTLDPDDPAFRWTDQGIVVRSSPTNDFNTIDPGVFADDDGSLWLVFGSFWSGIKLIQLDPETGKRVAPDSKIYSLAHFDSIEAPYIGKHDGYYYLFVNWGNCCRGTNSTYTIRIGRSKTVTGPYLDKNGLDLLTEGGTLFVNTEGAFIGPGHASIFSEKGTNWFGMHFYDGTRKGASTLAIRTLQWTTEGWPQLNP
jgi:arabinan endo-1,5-alpha-L-arabinosidase